MTLVKSKFKFYFQLYTFNTTTVPDKPSRVSFVNEFATPVDLDLFLLTSTILEKTSSIVDALQGPKYVYVECIFFRY